MALPINRPVSDVVATCNTTSIAGSPVAAATIAPAKGNIQRVMGAAGGTTTGTITVAVSVNGGSDIAGGALQIAAGTGARAGAVFELAALVPINEGDEVTFTPSGGTGTTIPGAFALVIRQ